MRGPFALGKKKRRVARRGLRRKAILYCMFSVQLVPPVGSYITGFICNEQNPRMPLVPGLAGVP